MIVLEQDKNNIFYLLLQHNYLLLKYNSNKYYFKIIDDVNNKEIVIEIENTSSSSYISEFSITTTKMKNEQDLANNIVYFRTNKVYTYQIIADNVIIDTNKLICQ